MTDQRSPDVPAVPDVPDSFATVARYIRRWTTWYKGPSAQDKAAEIRRAALLDVADVLDELGARAASSTVEASAIEQLLSRLEAEGFYLPAELASRLRRKGTMR